MRAAVRDMVGEQVCGASNGGGAGGRDCDVRPRYDDSLLLEHFKVFCIILPRRFFLPVLYYQPR